MTVKPSPLRCPCPGDRFETVFTYTAPPEGEITFAFSREGVYRRQVLRCELCGHFVSRHDMDTGAMYAGEYVDATYGESGIRRAFDRITGLDPAKSDNVGRVRRVLEFAAAWFGAGRAAPSILDVGSGLCVFLHRMKAAGWRCTALDPDRRAAAHAAEAVGVDAVCGDFMTIEDLGRFDVVSFNKVLEHVEDPVVMLAKTRRHLAEGGVVYVELPDGEAAAQDGPGREEFFIDHPHIFSAASLALLATRAGFRVVSVERLREPSTKYTLRAFLVAPETAPPVKEGAHGRD
jgi:SAM-dependent methyltransferase